MNFYEQASSPEMRYAYQLAYSMHMITEIPVSYNSAVDSHQDLCARAMIDAFYTHLRLLGDFLVKPTKASDFGPCDFGVLWKIPATVESERLREHWEVASKYVSHFSRVRVPDNLEDLDAFPVDAARLAEMAADALAVMALFIGAIEEASPPTGSAAELKLLRDRATALRLAFEESCRRIRVGPSDSP